MAHMGRTLSAHYRKRANQRQMAINEVDMRLGTYPWPDGKPRIDRSGAHKVVKRELLRSVGLSPEYQSLGKALFDDEYYKEQVALELARRNESFKLESQKFYNEALECAANMLHEVALRVKHAPTTLPTELLLKYLPTMLKVGIEIEARSKSESEGHKKPVSATQLFAQQLVYVDGQKGQEIVDALSENSEMRKEEILSLVRARNALEREDLDGEAVDSSTA
jgi:hypothetical protein